MSEPGFVVGGRYANAAGEYDVLAIDGNTVRIRYAKGFEMSLPAGGLWAQWEDLIAQRDGRPAEPAGPRTPQRRPAVKGSRSPAARPPKPKKSAGGEGAFYTIAGYLAGGCEITASVAGRDYLTFAQRYQIHTGRNLVTPHAGLDVHERPTHRMGAELAIHFPADTHTLKYLDFGGETAIELAEEPGSYVTSRTEIVERLFGLGFDLGPNVDPAPVREHVPERQRGNFDLGLSLRRALRR